MEDKELKRKIEKSKKYCNELERYKIKDFKVEMNSEHGIRTIKYDNEKGYTCTCDFYKTRHTCSHIMAIQNILKNLNRF